MENPTPFDLNHAIQRWRDGLSQSPHFRREDLAELEAHARDSVATLQAKGLTGEEAFWVATRRLGSPLGLEPEFAKINRGEVWRRWIDPSPAESKRRKEKMKRVFIFAGIVVALIGTAVILPALANYGRPAPMANDAIRFALTGALLTIAGAAAIIHGVRKRQA